MGGIAARGALPLQDFRGPARRGARHLRFFTAGAVDALLERHAELDFHAHLWPLIAKEAGYGYYRELFTGSPERVSTGWAEFSARFAGLDWYSPAREDLVAAAVPDPALRLDLEPWTGPSPGKSLGDAATSRTAVARYIEQDLALRDSPDHPETMALFVALLKVYMDLGRLVPAERLNARSQQTVHGWWHGFFSFVDSGPPPRRLREMLALHRAGLLRFLGPGLSVTADESTGEFVAGSPQTGFSVRAEGVHRGPAAGNVRGPLAESAAGLAALHRAGSEQQLLTADGIHSTGKLLVSDRHELLDGQGRTGGRLFGVGPGTSGWGAGAFARPNTNAAPFRENDALARTVLGVAAWAGFHPPSFHPHHRTGRTCRTRRRRKALKDECEDQLSCWTGRPDSDALRRPPLNPAALAVLLLPMHDPRVRPLLDELAVEYDSRYGDRFGRGAAAEELNRYPASEFEGPGGALLVIQENGESVAGGAFRRYDADTAEFKRIWTHSAHRRRGLARLVLAELEALAARRGYRRVYLTTGPRQPEAKHLYLTTGYEAQFDLDQDP